MNPIVIGFVWGGVFSSVLAFLNLHYDAIAEANGGTPFESPIFLGSLGFLALTALLIVVMLLSGILLALVGRGSPRRWRILASFFVGLAVGPMAARLIEAGAVQL
ncbi:hypothetical protein AAD018_007465 [Aestuariibius insulae]|uniref:hypothetical protein n=1 Tax=Aestuariibius insulae TaxID=2058287 RepID=UPI00345E0717